MSHDRTRPHRLAVTACAMALLMTTAGCSANPPARTDVVGALTEERVPARFGELAAEATVLVETAEALCGGDRSDPTAVLDQVILVRDRWAALRPFWFGPVMERRSQGLIDTSADPDDVARLLEGDLAVDPDSLRELVGADQRGLGAIEVLADDPDDRACVYLVSAAVVVAEETAALAAEWQTYGPARSVDDAAANATLTDIVSESLFALPLTGSDNPLAAPRLAGVRSAILGDDADDADEGISPLLDDQVVDQLRADFGALAAEPSFDNEMALERTIRTNVVGDLGITVKFSDADGDG